MRIFFLSEWLGSFFFFFLKYFTEGYSLNPSIPTDIHMFGTLFKITSLMYTPGWGEKSQLASVLTGIKVGEATEEGFQFPSSTSETEGQRKQNSFVGYP